MDRKMPKRGVTLVELMAVGLGLALCVALSIPILKKRIRERETRECQENLTRIDGAKEQWALENNKKPGDAPMEADIVRPGETGYLGKLPRCPSGHGYALNAIGTNPACASKLPGHGLRDISACISFGCE